MTPEQSMRAYLAECSLPAAVLGKGLADFVLRFNAEHFLGLARMSDLDENQTQ